MRVTVLVAAFNAVDMLPRCLDSLLSQTYNDVEIIVADDASTDDTLALLCQRYPSVRVVHLQQNMGQAVARNRALAVSTGDLITMVDADDWLSADALELAVSQFESDAEVDSVLFKLKRVYCNDGREEEFACPPSRMYSGREAFTLSLIWQLHGLYVARRYLYERVPFDTATRLYSDDNTTRLHYLLSRKVAVCDGIYYYYIHSGSCTNHIGFSRFHMQAALRSLHRSLLEYGVGVHDVRLFESYRWRMFVDGAYILYKYKECFTQKQRSRAWRILAATYKTFDSCDISLSHRNTMGFFYLPAWWQMRMQFAIYFPLQAIKMKFFS